MKDKTIDDAVNELTVNELTEAAFVRGLDMSIHTLYNQIYKYEKNINQLQKLYKDTLLFKPDNVIRYYYDSSNNSFYVETKPKQQIGFVSDLK